MIGAGALIGAALGIGSSIYGGIKAADAANKAKRGVEQQKRENEDWYNRRYNEDATQRADAQRILRMTADSIKQRNRSAAGAAAVGGGTEESVAATKAANAKAMADAASQIAAAGEARKDTIESQYRKTRSSLVDRLAGIEQGKAQAIAQATQGAGTAAMRAGLAVDGVASGAKSTVGGTAGQQQGLTGWDNLAPDDGARVNPDDYNLA